MRQGAASALGTALPYLELFATGAVAAGRDVGGRWGVGPTLGALEAVLGLHGKGDAVASGFAVGGGELAADAWPGRAPHNTLLELSSALLVEGTNYLSLKALSDGSGVTSQWYVNGFGLNYPGTLILPADVGWHF
ncbi:MAG: hypothetical protein ABSD29_21685 [Verrucomicrobiota bacterium]|jgi:hypothetical protein